MGKHYGHIIIDKVIEMQSRGLTLREIGEELGYERWQIHDVLVKHRRNERKIKAGIAPKKRGRPPKNCIVTEEDKIAALRHKLSRKDYRIKQLERENELLRDFLKETGRG